MDGCRCGLFTPVATCDTPGLLGAVVEEPEPTIKAIEASSLLNTGVAASLLAVVASSGGRFEPWALRAASPPLLPAEKTAPVAKPAPGLCCNGGAPPDDAAVSFPGAGGAEPSDFFEAEEAVDTDLDESFRPPLEAAGAGGLFLFEPPTPPPIPAGFLGCLPPPAAPVSPLPAGAAAAAAAVFFFSPS